MNERAHLEIMFNTLDASPGALCRFDRYGD
jgi:hypothetical protein